MPPLPERTITRVPCGDFFAVRDQALLAHATQIDPDEGWWFGVPLEVQQQAWPTEDYELVRSLVETELPESDLFAGLVPANDADRPGLVPADGVVPGGIVAQ